MQRLDESINANVNDKQPNEYDSLSLASLVIVDRKNENIQPIDVVNDYENYLTTSLPPYTQCIHFSIKQDDPLLKCQNYKIGPVSNGIATVANSLDGVNKKLSARMFVDDNRRLYTAMLRKIFSDTPIEKNVFDPDTFKPVADGIVIWVLAIIKNPRNQQWELQLRIIPRGEYGHPQLVLKEETDAMNQAEPIYPIIGAGEFFYNHFEGIVMANDKTGNFNQLLKKLNLNFKLITDYIFQPFYSDNVEQGFFAADENDLHVIEELIKREFPFSLMPQKYKEKYWAKLSPELQEQNRVNEKKYFDNMVDEIEIQIRSGVPYSCLLTDQRKCVPLDSFSADILAINEANEEVKKTVAAQIEQGISYFQLDPAVQDRIPLNSLSKALRDQAFENDLAEKERLKGGANSSYSSALTAKASPHIAQNFFSRRDCLNERVIQIDGLLSTMPRALCGK